MPVLAPCIGGEDESEMLRTFEMSIGSSRARLLFYDYRRWLIAVRVVLVFADLDGKIHSVCDLLEEHARQHPGLKCDGRLNLRHGTDPTNAMFRWLIGSLTEFKPS